MFRETWASLLRWLHANVSSDGNVLLIIATAILLLLTLKWPSRKQDDFNN